MNAKWKKHWKAAKGWGEVIFSWYGLVFITWFVLSTWNGFANE